MDAWLSVLVATLVCYLIGSLPIGYLLARSKGVDIRTRGSGNIGATNVWRNLGPAWGLLSLAGDAAKGIIAVLIGRVTEIPGAELITAAAALTGHGWSVFLRFYGGKIIATSLGVLIMLPSVGLVVAAITWIGTFFLTRYVSLSSILAAAMIPVAFLIADLPWWYPAFGIFLAAVAIYKHKENIRRLRAGEEQHFNLRV